MGATCVLPSVATLTGRSVVIGKLVGNFKAVMVLACDCLFLAKSLPLFLAIL